MTENIPTGAVRPAGKWERFQSYLARPVNGASLAVFRIGVGFVMALEAFSLLRPSASTSGRVMVETYYTGPDVTFNLPYAWFEWLPFLRGPGMYAVVGVLGIAALMMAAGLFYRISATLVFLAWGYLYAIESTRTYWMSYYYLELLVTFLLICMPAANRYSLDAIRSKGKRPSTVPNWTLLLLRGQLVITYFYSGVAKLNADWLLDAVPVRDFLLRSPFLTRLGNDTLRGETVAYFLSWAGAAFDLSIGFLLLFRRTRLVGMILLIGFHATNHFVLFEDIVWFPLVGVLTATIFLEPGWPERFFGKKASKAKSKQAAPRVESSVTSFINPLVAPLVVTWLLVQTVLPVRHYFIPGDGRFTWEGLSFSWRLKAEIYRSVPCEIFVDDHAVISRNADGGVAINWNNWRADKIIYSTVNPGAISWTNLSEIVVLFEPELGERIIYNPLAGGAPRTEAEATARANLIWQQLYGRAPQTIRRTVTLGDIAQGFETALKSQGVTLSNSRRENLAFFMQRYGREGNGKGLPLLRRLHPFALSVDQLTVPTAAPFLQIDDPALFEDGPANVPILKRSTWKSPAHSKKYTHLGSEPIILLVMAPTVENRSIFPPVCVMDSAENQEPPKISWDILRDLSISKAMHISTNPFLLRRYAKRVALLWQKEYGRRPAVHAKTAVSLNSRPPQPLVAEKADLASVPVSHWRHNPWITDLALPRIPKEGLQRGANPAVPGSIAR
jgi:vitamin K-dependent gamma-carboxylase